MPHNLLMEHTGRARTCAKWHLTIDTIAWSGLPEEFNPVVLKDKQIRLKTVSKRQFDMMNIESAKLNSKNGNQSNLS